MGLTNNRLDVLKSVEELKPTEKKERTEIKEKLYLFVRFM